MTQFYDPRADWTQEDAIDTCHECGEESEPQDPVAHFKHPTIFGQYVMAHGQCGEDAGLELA